MKMYPRRFSLGKLRDFYRNHLFTYLNIGFNYTCPICNYHGRKYAMRGQDVELLRRIHITGLGEYASRCPRCQGVERHRNIFLYLSKVAGMNLRHRKTKSDAGPRKSVLYIGENHSLEKILKANTRYISAEFLSPANSHEAYDLPKLDFPDSSFDLLICSHVLEHIIDDMQALCEIFRVVKRGGSAILQVPVTKDIPVTREVVSAERMPSEEERIRLYGKANHVRLYEWDDYISRLERAGFNVELYQPDKATIQKYNLQKDPTLFIAHKPA